MKHAQPFDAEIRTQANEVADALARDPAAGVPMSDVDPTVVQCLLYDRRVRIEAQEDDGTPRSPRLMLPKLKTAPPRPTTPADHRPIDRTKLRSRGVAFADIQPLAGAPDDEQESE